MAPVMPATSLCQPVCAITMSMAVANDANSVAQIMMKAQNSLMATVHAWNLGRAATA